MNYYTFFFRDLDNNLVLVKPGSAGMDFHVIEAATSELKEKAGSLPLNKVEVVFVREDQEDIFEMRSLFTLSVQTPDNEDAILAEIAEQETDTFLELIDKLYEKVQKDVAQKATVES